MTMPQRTVKINNHEYTFYLTNASQAFNASKKILAKATTLLPCLWDKKTEEFSSKFTELINEDFDYLFNTFIDKNTLYCDGKLIVDFDEHFAGKFTEIPQLLYKVIMENDRDFFRLLPTLINEELISLTEKLQANSLRNPEKMQGMEQALMKVAQNVKNNLG